MDIETANVYLITNVINDNIYVGVTKHKIENRLNAHIIESKRKNVGRVLQRAIRKHGFESFKIELLESFNSRKIALEAEQHYITMFRDQGRVLYNSTAGGEDGSLTSECRQRISHNTKLAMNDPEIKRKIREANLGDKNPSRRLPYTEERKRKLSVSHKGKLVSDETKSKLSKSLSGEKNPNFGKKFSEEHRSKMSSSIKIAMSKISVEERRVRSLASMTSEVKQLVSDKTRLAMSRPDVKKKHLEGCAKRRALSQEQEMQVRVLRDQGMSIRQIANVMNVSTTPIYRILAS